MKWFKHDSNAFSDAKIKKLIIREGAIGYAVYFHCLELITSDFSESNLTFELEHDSEIIADNLKIPDEDNQSGAEKVEAVLTTIVDLDLFNSEGNRIFCFKLANRFDSSMTSSTVLRKVLRKSHDGVMTKSCKNIKEKNKKEQKSDGTRFSKPSIDEIYQYCRSRKNSVDPQRFFDYYESKGWKVGQAPMKDWKAAVRTWESNNFSNIKKPDNFRLGGVNFEL